MSEIHRDSEHFVRQRRNLILASLVIIFYRAGNLQFDTINLLGNNITIGNPAIVPVCLATFFFYFAWRYYTACFEIRGWENYKSAMTNCIANYTMEIALDIASKKSGVDRNVIRLSRKNNSISEHGAFAYELSNTKGLSAHHKAVLTKEIKDNIVVEGITLMWCKIRSFMLITFRTSYSSQYLLPYVLAFIAFLELVDKGPVQASIEFLT